MQRVVVLLKYLLLLAICAPLGFFGYSYGKAFCETASADAGPRPPLSDPAKLKEAADLANSLGVSLQETRNVVVCVSDRDFQAPASGQLGTAVITASRSRGADLRDTRRLLEAMSKADPIGDVNVQFPDPEHPYGAYLKKRKENLTTVRERLKDVKVELDTLFADVQKSLDATPVKGPPPYTRIRAAVEKLRGYQADPLIGENEAGRRWVQEQLTSWEQAKNLLDLATSTRKVSAGDDSRAEIKTLLQKHAEMLDIEGLAPEFKDLVRGSIRRFCEAYLPETLPLDDFVKVGPGGGSVVKKADLQIVFKGAADGVDFLPRYDEFGLKSMIEKMEVDRFWHKVRQRGYDPPIEPTEKSAAAHQYNEWRKKRSWDSASLRDFHKAISKAHQDELGETWLKIDRLVSAMKGYEELFPAGK